MQALSLMNICHISTEISGTCYASLFGPTNMPPVEAFFMETPVVVSDLPGFGDQVGC